MNTENIEGAMSQVEGVRLVTNVPAPPPRPQDAHKGTFGSVLIVAGSEGMAGAACLAGQAALHGGAGLVTVAVPRSISTIVASAHPSYMTFVLDEDSDGQITPGAVRILEVELAKRKAVAVGPGLGQSPFVRDATRRLYATCSQPLVLDADGLNAFEGHAGSLSVRSDDAPRILTPHPGEFSRLTRLDTKTIQSNRAQHAVDFAKQHSVVLLLKGASTVITDGHRIAVNETGNCALATGGSGDVLTGLIASLLAQGMNAFDAAQLGAYLHGLAGDIMASTHSGRYATSADLLRFLDEAWKQVD